MYNVNYQKIQDPPGRIFAIGDIHGRYSELKVLLDHIILKENFDPENDLFIFLGDYVDRGPKSKSVIQELINLRQDFLLDSKDCVIFLKGNHEGMLMDFLGIPGGMEGDYCIINGGEECFKSYGLGRLVGTERGTYRSIMHLDSPRSMRAKFPKEHIEFLESLVDLVETASYIFVHAGLRPKILIEHQELDDLLWIRDDFLLFDLDFGKTVIHGHTPARNIYYKEIPDRCYYNTYEHYRS